MTIATTETIPNKKIMQVLGIAKGSTVRAKNIGSYIIAEIKNHLGGKLKEYTLLQAQSREEAIQRIKNDDRRLGADAIFGVRLATIDTLK